MITFYDVLEVDKDASIDKISENYKRLIEGEISAREKKMLKLSYKVLSNVESRMDYDNNLINCFTGIVTFKDFARMKQRTSMTRVREYIKELKDNKFLHIIEKYNNGKVVKKYYIEDTNTKESKEISEEEAIKLLNEEIIMLSTAEKMQTINYIIELNNNKLLYINEKKEFSIKDIKTNETKIISKEKALEILKKEKNIDISEIEKVISIKEIIIELNDNKKLHIIDKRNEKRIYFIIDRKGNEKEISEDDALQILFEDNQKRTNNYVKKLKDGRLLHMSEEKKDDKVERKYYIEDKLNKKEISEDKVIELLKEEDVIRLARTKELNR